MVGGGLEVVPPSGRELLEEVGVREHGRRFASSAPIAEAFSLR
jgi:hypothetical protein